MAKLQIKDESGKTTTVPLTRDEITIGRKEGNTIRLTERNVSRTHARFIKKGEEIHVEDLSRYGTRVNGERITETRRVGAGDTIQIGDYLLTLDGVKAVEDAGQRLAAAGAAAQAAAVPESKPRDEKKKAEIEAAARNQIAAAKAEALAEAKAEGKKEAPAPAAPAKKDPTIPPGDEEARKSRGAGKKRIGAVHPTLVAVTTHLAGTEYPITAETMILGRTGENDLKVDHHSISRNHAKVVVKDGKVKMVDLQSKNGIRVNGEYWEESSLKSGDIIELGKVQFRYVEKGEEFIFRPEDYAEGAATAAAAQPEAKKGGKGLLVVLLLLAAGGLAAVYFLVIAKPSEKPNVPNVPVATNQPATNQPATKPPETKPPAPDTSAAVQADTAQAVATKAAPDTAAPPKVDHSAEVKELVGKAKAAVDAQKWDDANTSLTAALALDAENADAKALQAKVASEKAVGAAFAEAQAAQVKNDLQAAWLALGKLASMPADSVYAARVNELKNAVGPAIANGYIDQAKQALAKKQWNDAIAKAEEAQKVVANQAEAPDIIAKARRGKAEDAKKEAEKAAKDPNKDPAKDPNKNPKDPPKPGKTGEELYKDARAIHNTDPAAAQKLYEQAAAAGYASAYKMIGSIKIQKGDNAGAIAAYKRYLSLVPTAKDADTVRDIIIRLGGTP